MTRWQDWTPGRGDVVSVRSGARGRRPALVLSPAAYSARTGFALVCPLADEAGGYPFEVEVPHGLVDGRVILADRVSSLEVRAWGMRRVCRLPDDVVAAVLERLAMLTRSLEA